MRVLGAGICGCAAAALLAEAGVEVVVVDPAGVASGASGRNQGLVQHPLDEALAPLYARSLELHGLADREPDGLLVLGEDLGALAAEGQVLTERFGVAVELLARAADAEPEVAPDLAGLRIGTGIVVGPAAVTEGWWARAQAAGASLVPSTAAAGGADVTLVCTGAATPGVTPLWGVVAEVGRRLSGHALEAAGVGTIARPDGAPPELFTLIATGLGSSFAAAEPTGPEVAARLHAGGVRYVPALADLAVGATRVCARPLSPDGRPFIGPIGDGVHVLTGHGPWGVTLAPASAELAVAAILSGAPVPEAYAASRMDEAVQADIRTSAT